MSKGRKLWLQPGFIANQVKPDYERERDERIKRNNEVLNSLGLKSIATSLWGSAQHKRANDNGKHSKDELDDDFRPPDDENVHAYDSDIDLSLPKRSKNMRKKKCRILDVEVDSGPNKSPNVSQPQPQPTPTHSHSASHLLLSHLSSQPTPRPSASQPLRPQPQPVQQQIVQPQHGQQQLIQPQPAQQLPIQPQPAQQLPIQPQPTQPQPPQPQPAQPQPIQPQEQDNFELGGNIDDEIFNEVEVGIRDESNIRTKRGITRLSDIWNLPPGKKVVVDFNATCLPVGEEGGVFNRFIGTVARKPHLCPINCKSWHVVPNHYKEDCWSIIESKFFIPDDERDQIKNNTLKSLGEKLRAWRCSLKAKYYDESKTAAQVVATAPPTVNPEQYADLVSYWYSTDGQEKREEVGVSRTMLYEPTHTKKDGKTPVSDKAAENMLKMKDLMASQQSPPEENTKGKINWSKNDIYSQVIDEKEHSGRFRGLGFGHTSKTCGSTSNSDARLRVASNEERMREKDNYIVVLEDKLNSAVSELNIVKSVVEFLVKQSGFQVQDIASGILNQVSPRANQGSSFASHEIEAPLGGLPSTLGNLSSLMNLTAYNNSITGNIPDTLGGCKKLEVLKLGGNKLFGPSTTVGIVQIGLKQLGSALVEGCPSSAACV
ncbi:hypothetical protein RHMOL_Rhmol08G0029300 [Rhododendron molle]|uniref:Uncharacterized protein n=1 Tax=Rhododendron molle TaxID=49168 RepID=A0ACC0MJR7_RHOML|nr:hypothetical protein RHMOL_Rhmol08G0029300 [Rhododendron molle]